MPTDVKWTWTILMSDGRSIHFPGSFTIEDVLLRFYAKGFQEPEIEAIIRH